MRTLIDQLRFRTTRGSRDLRCSDRVCYPGPILAFAFAQSANSADLSESADPARARRWEPVAVSAAALRPAAGRGRPS